MKTNKKNIIKNLVLEELVIIKNNSMNYSNKIKQSKTNYKKLFYKKKLKKNNELLTKYLFALENLEGEKKC